VSGPAPAIPLDARPKLTPGVRLECNEGPPRRRWLLSPERVFKVDAVAVEIINRCTGEATLDAIVDDLAKVYSAPRSRILADVMAFLRDLSDKNLLEL
jgi:pyrroloquinoline quinone biosynthesis protein D